MTQSILNFELQSTNEKLTPRTGIAILGEYLKGMNLERICNDTLPKAKHPNGYTPFEFIYPLILLLHSGGRVLDDIETLRSDLSLKTLLKIENIPTQSAISKYLARHGLSGEESMREINKIFLHRYIKKLQDEEITLDIDATFIEAHKNTAKWSYKNAPGYMTMVGHINNGWVVDVDFREGSETPSSKNLEFIKQCQKQLPKDKKLSRLRADSASYQAAIFNYCQEMGIRFSVTAKKDAKVLESIKSIEDEKWQHFSNKEKIIEFIHTMDDTKEAFRMIVIKKDITPPLPTIEEYISDEVMKQYQDTIYYCIATNDNDLTPEEIVHFHRQRGEASENKIKELKNGFNMSYLPTSNFEANAFYFYIGSVAYNLFLLFKQILDKSLQKHTVKRIRYKLYNIAGKVITHARKTIVKVSGEFMQMFQAIRQRAYEESLE